MKYKSILVAGLLCASISCTDMELMERQRSPTVADEFGTRSTTVSNGGTSALSLKPVSLSTLQTGTSQTLSAVASNPSSFLTTENGITFARLKDVTGSTAFAFANDVRVLVPQAIASYPYDAVRAQISNNLNGFTTSANFKGFLLAEFDYMRNIDARTFNDFRAHYQTLLLAFTSVRSTLSQHERFALTQAIYSVLNIATWANQNPTQVAGQCLPKGREEWKQVAESAFTAGLGLGAKMGFDGAVAGAIATTAAGNPILGGVVGGIIGFTTGFVMGAVGGGAVKLMWHCMSNTLFAPLMTIRCGNRTYQAYTASPPVGCTGSPSTNLADIALVPLVPNSGYSSINPTVMADLNWMLQQL
jgi:hypothetical protein